MNIDDLGKPFCDAAKSWNEIYPFSENLSNAYGYIDTIEDTDNHYVIVYIIVVDKKIIKVKINRENGNTQVNIKVVRTEQIVSLCKELVPGERTLMEIKVVTIKLSNEQEMVLNRPCCNMTSGRLKNLTNYEELIRFLEREI